jgi:(p)ppGpp synthase/HD superfamily hydrolase
MQLLDLKHLIAFVVSQHKDSPDMLSAAHFPNWQVRKTGEPYVTHCIETALIVESNLPHWRHDSRCALGLWG